MVLNLFNVYAVFIYWKGSLTCSEKSVKMDRGQKQASFSCWFCCQESELRCANALVWTFANTWTIVSSHVYVFKMFPSAQSKHLTCIIVYLLQSFQVCLSWSLSCWAPLEVHKNHWTSESSCHILEFSITGRLSKPKGHLSAWYSIRLRGTRTSKTQQNNWRLYPISHRGKVFYIPAVSWKWKKIKQIDLSASGWWRPKPFSCVSSMLRCRQIRV